MNASAAIAAFCILIAPGFRADDPGEPPALLASDIPGGTITRAEHFNGTSLWGYIDGGADVYLEYGFKSVLVQELRWQDHRFKLDIYQMKSAESAFGIFSASRHRCPRGDTLARFSCFTPHQVQIAQGDLYLSIVNDGGTEEEQASMRSIARTILGRCGERAFMPPKIFTEPPNSPETLIFMNGPLGLQNGFPDWQELFDGMKDFSIYLLPLEMNGGYVYTARIHFSGEKDKMTFYLRQQIQPPAKDTSSSRTDKGLYRMVKEATPTDVNYLESNIPSSALDRFIRALEIMD